LRTTYNFFNFENCAMYNWPSWSVCVFISLKNNENSRAAD